MWCEFISRRFLICDFFIDFNFWLIHDCVSTGHILYVYIIYLVYRHKKYRNKKFWVILTFSLKTRFVWFAKFLPVILYESGFCQQMPNVSLHFTKKCFNVVFSLHSPSGSFRCKWRNKQCLEFLLIFYCSQFGYCLVTLCSLLQSKWDMQSFNVEFKSWNQIRTTTDLN